MRILITGAKGQVGRELSEVFEAAGTHEVIACGREELDLASRDSVLGVITTNEPELILHSGGYTAVDNAEADVDTCFAVNAMGTRHVAHAARTVGARVVYLSTDYVFDGELDRPYDEWDTPNPRSVYGRSKLAGEMELGDEDTIVRTSWVFGRYGASNMVKKLVGMADMASTFTFVDDQVGKPTNAQDLAEAIYSLSVSRMPGVFNITNEDAVSWFQFARSVFELVGADPERITPVSSDDLQPPRPAYRPRNSVLDNRALRLSGMTPLPSHREAAERVVKELKHA